MYSMPAVRRVFCFRVVLHAQGSRWMHPTLIPGERETACACAPRTHDAAPSTMQPRSPPIAAREERTKTRQESCYLHGPTLPVSLVVPPFLVHAPLMTSSDAHLIPTLIPPPACTSAQLRYVLLLLRVGSSPACRTKRICVGRQAGRSEFELPIRASYHKRLLDKPHHWPCTRQVNNTSSYILPCL
jgi:hypothetical protein